jgi:hypothetical protein
VSDTYDLLPVAWGLAVPQRVCDVLVDMGSACNEAALTLDEGYVEHRRAINLADGAEACGEYAPFRRHFARRWFDCTLSYTDQLTAVYTMVAGTFAAYAVAVAVAVADGADIPAPGTEPTAPSRLLGEPDLLIPLVQMPVGTHWDDAPLVEHNADLAARHRTLVEIVSTTLLSYPVDVYDDPGRLANRPARSVELRRHLAHALHGYAATCAWAIGMKTRP